jgi:peptidoglycan/LPS O-acetylase OafA/YrhL
MAKFTIVFAILLIILGIVGFVMTGSQHPTALIPTFFGVVFEALGVLTLVRPQIRKHTMHAAAALALIGFFGTITGVIGLIKWAAGTEPAQPAAVISKSIMAVLCLIYVALCVRSFINARREREAQPT